MIEPLRSLLYAPEPGQIAFMNLEFFRCAEPIADIFKVSWRPRKKPETELNLRANYQYNIRDPTLLANATTHDVYSCDVNPLIIRFDEVTNCMQCSSGYHVQSRYRIPGVQWQPLASKSVYKGSCSLELSTHST
jgi:hypothetical protein